MAISISVTKPWILEAGEMALARFQHARRQYKEGGEIVTQADREIEAFLVGRLRSAYPDTAILGEETGTHGEGEACLWALDPIDGTRAFASGLPVWGIALGLLEHAQPTQGVFYLPVLRDYYQADAEGTATCNDRPLEPLHAESWDANTLLCVPSDAHRRYELDFPGITRSLGSTAAHLIYVARGTAVGALLSRTRLWDIAAALAILFRVGGAVCYLSGKDVELAPLLDGSRTPEPIIAAHPALLEPLRQQIGLRHARAKG